MQLALDVDLQANCENYFLKYVATHAWVVMQQINGPNYGINKFATQIYWLFWISSSIIVCCKTRKKSSKMTKNDFYISTTQFVLSFKV